MNSKNILSRIRNSLVTAINEHSVLPKLIVVVTDDDIINQVADDPDVSLVFHYERLCSGLCNLLNKTIDCYKDMLPQKAKREGLPHIVWIAPPTHKFFSDENNKRRTLFADGLNIAVNAQSNMSLLQMVKFWDHNNSNLFMDEQYRYTSEGLAIYWRSVYAAVRFWNVALAKKVGKNKNAKGQIPAKTDHKSKEWFKHNPRFNHHQPNRYKWYRNNEQSSRRRRLSTPP